jgi:hypothetical protein
MFFQGHHVALHSTEIQKIFFITGLSFGGRAALLDAVQQYCPLCREQSSDKQFPVVPQYNLYLFASSVIMYRFKTLK